MISVTRLYAAALVALGVLTTKILGAAVALHCVPDWRAAFDFARESCRLFRTENHPFPCDSSGVTSSPSMAICCGISQLVCERRRRGGSPRLRTGFGSRCERTRCTCAPASTFTRALYFDRILSISPALHSGWSAAHFDLT
ncbi:hypothetical protein MRX96_007680 [Rhipicephalus microplus]